MYSNPYYAPVAGAPVYYDYSQPIQVVNQPAMTAGVDDFTQPVGDYPPEVQDGTSHTDLARDLFKQGDYAGAGREIDLALQKLPKDAALHEFRALIQFATGDYNGAAGTLYAVLSAGPGWDWTTLSSMYPSVDVYTKQLRDLEAYVKQHPDDAAARFDLAYQYITAGHNDAAARQLKEVVRLQPNDQLSANLLKMTEGNTSANDANPPAATTAGTEDQQPQLPDIDPAKIVGNWSAQRPDGASFSLNLTPDNKFAWNYSQGNRKENFEGKYTVDGAVLVLERPDGAQMPALITQGPDGFNFKLYGGPENDPGLDFKK